MSSSDDQLRLDLGAAPALGRADFVTAPGNGDALAFIERWPDWPGGVLAIYGAAGSGKSHLVAIWHGLSGGKVLPASALTAAAVPDLAGRHLALEDVDAGVDQEALLHLYNLTRERGASLLMTGREPPRRWPAARPDLASRLAAATAVAIGLPDDGLIEAVLVKQFADRQLRADAELISWLVAHIERSFAAARKAVDDLDRAALADRKSLNVAFARKVLGAAEQERKIG